MKISIVIPVYNVESFIKKCLDSIINQTYGNFEVILVDDGSTDKSGSICDEYASKDKRIKVYHKKNGGAARARNFGINKISGDYLFFVDGDDYIDKNALEKMIAKAVNNDIVYCDYKVAFSDGKVEDRKLISFPLFNDRVHVTAMPTPCCKLIKTSFFKKSNIKFLEGMCFEDNAIMPVLSAEAKNTFYLEEPLYFYYQRAGSTLNSIKYNPKWEDIFDVLNYMKGEFVKRGLFDKYYQEVEYIFIEHLLHAANLRFFDYKEGRTNIKKVHNVMKSNFPNWPKNIYLKQENWKYKLMCRLFYGNHLFIISLIRRKK